MDELNKVVNSKALFVNPSSDPKSDFSSVLILEGRPDTANAFGYAIKEHLSNVLAIVCNDPQKCLNLVPEMYFDCLVCDMDNPELEGAKVIHEFQSRLSPTTVTIACTADSRNEDLWKDRCSPEYVYTKPDKLNAQELMEFASIVKTGLSIAHEYRTEAFGYDPDK
jgi:CheY-like chemotaxis protein